MENFLLVLSAHCGGLAHINTNCPLERQSELTSKRPVTSRLQTLFLALRLWLLPDSCLNSLNIPVIGSLWRGQDALKRPDVMLLVRNEILNELESFVDEDVFSSCVWVCTNVLKPHDRHNFTVFSD